MWIFSLLTHGKVWLFSTIQNSEFLNKSGTKSFRWEIVNPCFLSSFPGEMIQLYKYHKGLPHWTWLCVFAFFCRYETYIVVTHLKRLNYWYRNVYSITINSEERTHMLMGKSGSTNNGNNLDKAGIHCCWWWLWVLLWCRLLEECIGDRDNNSIKVSVFMAWEHNSFCHSDS